MSGVTMTRKQWDALQAAFGVLVNEAMHLPETAAADAVNRQAEIIGDVLREITPTQ